MPTASLRVLGRTRLSQNRDESTSIERQREVVQRWADAHGHQVIGWAEDVDVSGSVDPFEAPALAEWLDQRREEWDVLAVWKLDRLGRNAITLNRVFGWMLEHGKTLVSCSESIDLGSWAGRMLANVIAGLAEGELEAIRERVTASRQKLRESARWPGGKPPYGYRAVPIETGGWSLVVDEPAADVVRRIVGDLLDGTPITQVARTLTSEGVPTPAAYYAASRGMPVPEGRHWTTTPLRNMLRSPALLGRVHHNGVTVRDDNGQPLQLAEPIITAADYQTIQELLDGNAAARKDDRRSTVSLLTGLVFCWFCEEPLHHDLNSVKRPNRVYVYPYYRCRSRKHKIIPAGALEQLATDKFLDDWGSLPVQERVWVRGDNNETAISEAVRAIDELSKLVGTMTSETARGRLQRQLAALDEELARLESVPTREGHYELIPVGGTYADAWAAADVAGKRELLRKRGLTFYARITDGSIPGLAEGLWCEIATPEDAEQPT